MLTPTHYPLSKCVCFGWALHVAQGYSAADTTPESYSVGYASDLLLRNALCRVLLLLKGLMLTSALGSLHLPPSTPHSPSCLLWQECLPTGRGYDQQWKPCSIFSLLEMWFVFSSGRAVSINDKMPAVRSMKANRNRWKIRVKFCWTTCMLLHDLVCKEAQIS